MCLEFHYCELFINCNLLLLSLTYIALGDKNGIEKKNKINCIILSSDSPAQICLSVLSACARDGGWPKKMGAM